MSRFARTDDRWNAITRRDRIADGAFVYGVATTGVFCRPSCASRQPLRKNVELFDTPDAAVRAGFRACKRCTPTTFASDDENAARVVKACRLLEQGDVVRNEELARAVALSPFHFLRVFKARVGVTPQAYRRRVLAERANGAMSRAPSVTAAIYDAGYSSSSRFYDGAARELGMTPRIARSGAEGEQVTYVVRRCSLGRLLVAWTERGACDVRFADTEREAVDGLRARFPNARLERRAPPSWVADVVAAVERPRPLDIPIDIEGTAFQQRVWQELRRIPVGETRSYAEIAAAMGAPHGARAVARACSTNHVAVVVPCHRVVRADGDESGYRWGAARKRTLLRAEGASR